jgi:UDP-N-acetylmuramoyl-L-alanyl-D-glutamate--2,6-diaminopimelate ligase
LDDKSYSVIAPQIKSKLSFEDSQLLTYSLTNQTADFTPKKFPFKTQLLGDFNISNSLAAITVAKVIGIDDQKIRSALLSFKAPPGRQEVVYNKDFKVIIDFAHTPNGFAKILPEVKKITKGKLIHLFGSAGLRDQTKRPEMGEESAKYADIIILTAEDPRVESVANINAMIKKGINIISNRKPKLFEIPDRKEAIDFAIQQARKGDTVILTGKSHEKSMNLGNGEQPWDEFITTLEAIRQK